jgi:ABC-type antimicrobial peptide transport system permease subunit
MFGNGVQDGIATHIMVLLLEHLVLFVVVVGRTPANIVAQLIEDHIVQKLAQEFLVSALVLGLKKININRRISPKKGQGRYNTEAGQAREGQT